MMRRAILLFTLMAAALLVGSGVALAASVNEVEPNDSIEQAQNIDGSAFSLDPDPNIGNKYIDTSQIVPHATVIGTGDYTVDYYSFTVSNRGDGVILDVDGAAFFDDDGNEDGFGSWLALYDSSGTLLAQNDNAPYSWGMYGSAPVCGSPCDSSSDSYLEYTFESPGTYYAAVGSSQSYQPGSPPGLYPIPSLGGGSYQLQVSLGKIDFPGPLELGERVGGDAWNCNFDGDTQIEKCTTADGGHLMGTQTSGGSGTTYSIDWTTGSILESGGQGGTNGSPDEEQPGPGGAGWHCDVFQTSYRCVGSTNRRVV